MNSADMHLLPQNLDRDYPVIVRGEGCYLYDDSGAQYLDGTAGGVSAGRIGRAEEVAGAVVMVASEDSSYITGQTISVGGGQMIT